MDFIRRNGGVGGKPIVTLIILTVAAAGMVSLFLALHHNVVPIGERKSPPVPVAEIGLDKNDEEQVGTDQENAEQPPDQKNVEQEGEAEPHKKTELASEGGRASELISNHRLIIDEEARKEIMDLTPIQHEQGYYDVLEKLASLTPAEVTSAVSPSIKWEHYYLQDATEARGAFVKAYGRLFLFERRGGLYENAAGLDHIWAGCIVDNRSRTHIFHLVGEPDWQPKVRDDVVEIEGVFLKVIKYKNVQGQTAYAPFILARNIRKVEEPHDQMFVVLQIVVGAIAGMGIILVLVAGLTGRKGEREMEKRLRKMRFKSPTLRPAVVPASSGREYAGEIPTPSTAFTTPGPEVPLPAQEARHQVPERETPGAFTVCFSPDCGAQNPPNAVYCCMCGTRLRGMADN